ncbi:MAG: FKBP-type peptidyl-prolyl cis-trans isomerase [Deltaproteobacteria bacterium]|nr:FKBP-type peptidyl-prolyl cis-trans isomerase [Deltaproteobacteria bacterium]
MDEKGRINYSIGYQIGGDFKRQGIELAPDLLVQGIRDAAGGAEPRMPAQEMRKTLVELKKKVEADERMRRREKAGKHRAEGEAFLAANGKKEGVTILPSGLQYKVLAAGKGKSPGPSDNVTVHYRGNLVDGTEFDSSHQRNAPATFGIDRVIAGWKEALPMMKEGAKWQLFVPSKLGYGEQGSGSKIPPNSVLIFEVELISVGTGK